MNPDREVIPLTYQGLVKEPFVEPWLSFGYLENEPVLVAGIVDRVITLPAHNHPKLLKDLDPNFKQHKVTQMIPAPFKAGTHPVGPFGVLLDDQFFVWPDVLMAAPARGVFFRVRRDGGPPDQLRQIPREKFEELRQQPHEHIVGQPRKS